MADHAAPLDDPSPVNPPGQPPDPAMASTASPSAETEHLMADKQAQPATEETEDTEKYAGGFDLEEEPKLYIAEDTEVGQFNGDCENPTASENSEKPCTETSEKPSTETTENLSNNENLENPSVKETFEIPSTSENPSIENSDSPPNEESSENPPIKKTEIPLFGNNSESPSVAECSEKPFLDRSDTGSFDIVGEHCETPSRSESLESRPSEDVNSTGNRDQNDDLGMKTVEPTQNEVERNEEPATQQSSHSEALTKDRNEVNENSLNTGDIDTDRSNTVLDVNRDIDKSTGNENAAQNVEQMQKDETQGKVEEDKAVKSPASVSNPEHIDKPQADTEECNQTAPKPKPKPEQSNTPTGNTEQSSRPAFTRLQHIEPAANNKHIVCNELAAGTEQSNTPTTNPKRTEQAARIEQASKPTASPVSGSFDWSSIGLYRCPNCRFTVDDEQLFKNHVTTCTKVNQGQVRISCNIGIPMSYTCDTCAISWTNKAEFEEHVVCHIVDNPYLCITCRRNFHSRYAIEKHAKTDHPAGDSRCALRGMKKCREFVKQVEIHSKYSFEGKLHIPKTPRNQIKGTSDDVDGEVNTPVATMPSPRPNIAKFMNSTVTSTGTGVHIQPRTEVVTLATASPAVVASVPVGQFLPKSSTIEYRPQATSQTTDPNSLFKVMDSQSGTFQPLTLPSKLQKLVNVTSANTEAKTRTDLPPPPPYHVKHFTQFTQGSTHTITNFTQAVSQTTNSATAVTTLSSTPVWLIPVGPPMPMMTQANQQTPPNTVTQVQTAPALQTNQQFQQPGQVAQTPMVINAQPSNQIVFLAPESGSKSPLNSQPVTTFTSPPNLTVPTVPQPRATVSPRFPFNKAPPPLKIPPGAVTRMAISSRLPWNRSPTNSLSPPGLKLGYPAMNTTQPTTIQGLKQVPPALGKSLINPTAPVTSVAPTEVITIPSTSDKDRKYEPVQKKAIDKTYTFRIKPQKGFVCESCRKFTRDELVFRKHVWDHFHIGISSCKYCKKEVQLEGAKKGVMNCQLVNDIVCKLVKNTVQLQNSNETIVIDITDEDDEESSKKRDRRAKNSESQAIEVIVVDDDETENDSLNIKITSSYSLHDPETEFENMREDASEKTVQPKESEKDVIQVEDTDNKMDVGSADVLVLDDDDDDNDKDDVGVTDDHHDDDDDDVNGEVETTDDKEPRNSKTEASKKSTPEPPKPSINTVVSDAIDQIFSKEYPNSDFAKPTHEKKVKNKKSKKSKKEALPTAQEETGPVANKEAGSTASNSESTDALANASTVLSQKEMYEAEVISVLGYLAFYMCGYEQCSFSCLTSLGYKEHLQSQHLNSLSNYVCCHCGRKDYNDDSHTRHMYAHASNSTKAFYLYKCPLRQCKYKTNLTHMYKEHIKKHDDLIISCFYCHKIFTSIDSLLNHLSQNLLKFINCPYCSFKFMQRDVVVNHIKMFHPDKLRMITVSSQIICQEREINFYVEPLAKQPKVVKDIDRDMPSTDIVSITKLLDEVKQTGAGQDDDEDNEAMEVDLVSDSESTKTTSTTAETSKREDGPPTISPEGKSGTKASTKAKHRPSLGGPKSLRCHICSYLSYNMPLHVQHVSSHENEPEREKRYVCTLCPKGSDNINHFKKHVENHLGTNELKIFNCTTCTYSSNQKCHIMDHCSDNHGGKGMYVQNIHQVTSKEDTCKYCDFKSRTLDQVLQHEEQVHRVSVGERTDKPPVLEKQTSGSSKAQTESGKKKKYHCQYCQNYFKHKIDLKAHLENEHMEIENKEFAFYKCKYCSHTSTMKDFIVAHMGKAHPDSEMRILRKIESIESKKAPAPRQEEQAPLQSVAEEPSEDTSIDKEKIGIPDGNMFKQPFKCPKCSFSSNLRIAVMRHIKTHPELAPVREVQMNKAKKTTARKSTGQSQDFPARKHGALYQDVPKSQLKNPFTSLKGADDQNAAAESESYVLGESGLHSKLSACFIPLEKDTWFRCRICTQKIAKKFVLHRHMLDHLNIVFFKCRYCSEGTIDKSLLFGHIQKEHPQQSLAYTKVSKAELDSQFMEKIFKQDFNDTISMDNMADRPGSPTHPTGIITKAVNEQKKAAVPVPAESQTEKKKSPTPPVAPVIERDLQERTFKCPHCNHTTRRKDYIQRHIEAHSDPDKDSVCQGCNWIGTRFTVLKHCYRTHGIAQIKERDVSHLKKSPEANKSDKKSDAKPIVKSEVKPNSSTDSPATMSSVDELESIEDTADDKEEKEDAKDHYIKTMYKCFECGTTREGVSGMYHHFRNTKKCNRPIFKCSLCAFKSATKIDITRHSKVRHPGKNFVIIPLTMKAKMKLIKIPVKYKGMASKAGSEDRSEAGSTDSRASSVTKADAGTRCGLCKFESDTLMGLQFHINTRHGGKQLYCQECSYKTPLVKHMINHCKNVHRQNKAIYKQEPKKSQVKVKSQDDHASSVASSSLIAASDTKPSAKQIQCLKCNYKTDIPINLRRHIYTHFTYKPYQCKFCDAGRYEKGCLKKHFKKNHPNKPVFQYKYVKDEAAEARIDKLFRKAQKKKKLADMVTGASRPSKIDKFPLVEEGIRKEDGNSYYCDFCGHNSRKKDHIRKHYEKKHGANMVSSQKRARESDDSLLSSPARKIPKLEKDQLDVLTSESEDEHREQSSSSPLKYSVVVDGQGKTMYKCPHCDYQVPKKGRLKYHSLKHGARLFKCLLCDFSTKLISNGYRHVKNLHRGSEMKLLNKKTGKVVTKKPWIGDTSPARSVKDESIVSTDESPPFRPRKEVGVLKYCCNVCDRKIEGMLPFRQHLATHPEHFTRIVIGQGTSFRLSCGYCSYMAIDESDYISHKATHYGDRRYRCGHCDYTAFIRSGVIKHMRNLHSDKPETVIDRDEKQFVSSKLVELEPKLVLEQVDRNGEQEERSFKRIRTMSDSSVESVGESFCDQRVLCNEIVAQEMAPVEHGDGDFDENVGLVSETEEMEIATSESASTKLDEGKTTESSGMEEEQFRITEESADRTIKQVSDMVTRRSQDMTTDDSRDGAIDENLDRINEESSGKVTNEISDKVTEGRTEKVTDEISDKVTERSKDKTTEENQDKTTEDSQDKTTEESQDKTTEENQDKTTEESQDKTTEENLEMITGDNPETVSDKSPTNMTKEMADIATEKSQDTVEEENTDIVAKDNATEQESLKMHDSGVDDTGSEELIQDIFNRIEKEKSEMQGVAIDTLDKDKNESEKPETEGDQMETKNDVEEEEEISKKPTEMDVESNLNNGNDLITKPTNSDNNDVDDDETKADTELKPVDAGKEALDTKGDTSLENSSNFKQEDTSRTSLKSEECADAHSSDFKQVLDDQHDEKDETLKRDEDKLNDETLKIENDYLKDEGFKADSESLKDKTTSLEAENIDVKDDCLKIDKNKAEFENEEAHVSDMDARSKMSAEEAEHDDCETDLNEQHSSESMPTNPETQPFESSEDMSFDCQSSLGFEMGSQNFLVVDTYESAGQDSSSSDKENMDDTQESSSNVELNVATSESSKSVVVDQTEEQALSKSNIIEMEVNHGLDVGSVNQGTTDTSSAGGEEMEVD